MAYRGIPATLPFGLTGLNGSLNIGDLLNSDLIETDGVVIEGGTIRKEPGATKLNNAALAGPVYAGINWSPFGEARRDYIAVFTGADLQIRKDTGAGTFGTLMETFLAYPIVSDVPNTVFVPAGGEAQGATRKLFLFDANYQTRYVNGDANVLSAMPNEAADWGIGNRPTFGVLHANRLWAAGNNNDPHRLYVSDPADHTNFINAAALTFSVFPGEGDRIVGAISFRGSIVVFKYPVGIYIIDTSDPSPSGWIVDRITRSVGAVSMQTIIQISNDVMFLDHGGNIHLMSAVQEKGDVAASNISAPKSIDEYMRRNLDLGRLRRASGVWDWTRQQALFGLSRLGSTTNDFRLLADLSDPSTGVRWFTSTRDTNESLWMRPDASGGQVRPMFGDVGGFVWHMNITERTKDGVRYGMNALSAPIDFSFVADVLQDRTKTGQFIDVTYQPVDDTAFTINIIWDGQQTDAKAITPLTAGAALGSFILDTSELGGVTLDLSGLLSRRRRIVGSGRRLQIRVNGASTALDVQIVRLRMGIKAMVERDVETG